MPAPTPDNHASEPSHANGSEAPAHLTAVSVPASSPRWRRGAAWIASWGEVSAWGMATRIGLIGLGAATQYAAQQRGVTFIPFLEAGTYPHYADVASNGYTADNAFAYPLLPTLMAALAKLGIPLQVAAMLITNVCFFVGLLLFAEIGKRFVGSSAAARAAILLAVFPLSYAFSLASTESLMLTLALGSVLAARNDRWWLAALLAALCALTRPPGMFVAAVLLGAAIDAWRSGRLTSPRQKFAAGAALAAPALAVAGFFAYLSVRVGDPLAAVHAQRQFGRSSSLTGPFTAVSEALSQVAQKVIGPGIELLALAGILTALTWFVWRVVPRATDAMWEARGWAALALLSLLLALSTGSVWQMPRFALLMPPVFWAAAVVLRRPAPFLGISVLLLMGMCARYTFEIVGVTR